MPIQEAEEKYAEINYYFSGDDTLKNGKLCSERAIFTVFT